MNSMEMQQEMENHLKGVKENLRPRNEVGAAIAQAHATAALAIAVSVGLSDIELTLAGIKQELVEIDSTLASGDR